MKTMKKNETPSLLGSAKQRRGGLRLLPFGRRSKTPPPPVRTVSTQNSKDMSSLTDREVHTDSSLETIEKRGHIFDKQVESVQPQENLAQVRRVFRSESPKEMNLNQGIRIRAPSPFTLEQSVPQGTKDILLPPLHPSVEDGENAIPDDSSTGKNTFQKVKALLNRVNPRKQGHSSNNSLSTNSILSEDNVLTPRHVNTAGGSPMLPRRVRHSIDPSESPAAGVMTPASRRQSMDAPEEITITSDDEERIENQGTDVDSDLDDQSPSHHKEEKLENLLEELEDEVLQLQNNLHDGILDDDDDDDDGGVVDFPKREKERRQRRRSKAARVFNTSRSSRGSATLLQSQPTNTSTDDDSEIHKFLDKPALATFQRKATLKANNHRKSIESKKDHVSNEPVVARKKSPRSPSQKTALEKYGISVGSLLSKNVDETETSSDIMNNQSRVLLADSISLQDNSSQDERRMALADSLTEASTARPIQPVESPNPCFTACGIGGDANRIHHQESTGMDEAPVPLMNEKSVTTSSPSACYSACGENEPVAPIEPKPRHFFPDDDVFGKNPMKGSKGTMQSPISIGSLKKDPSGVVADQDDRKHRVPKMVTSGSDDVTMSVADKYKAVVESPVLEENENEDVFRRLINFGNDMLDADDDIKSQIETKLGNLTPNSKRMLNRSIAIAEERKQRSQTGKMNSSLDIDGVIDLTMVQSLDDLLPKDAPWLFNLSPKKSNIQSNVSNFMEMNQIMTLAEKSDTDTATNVSAQVPRTGCLTFIASVFDPEYQPKKQLASTSSLERQFDVGLSKIKQDQVNCTIKTDDTVVHGRDAEISNSVPVVRAVDFTLEEMKLNEVPSIREKEMSTLAHPIVATDVEKYDNETANEAPLRETQEVKLVNPIAADIAGEVEKYVDPTSHTGHVTPVGKNTSLTAVKSTAGALGCFFSGAALICGRDEYEMVNVTDQGDTETQNEPGHDMVVSSEKYEQKKALKTERSEVEVDEMAQVHDVPSSGTTDDDPPVIVISASEEDKYLVAQENSREVSSRGKRAPVPEDLVTSTSGLGEHGISSPVPSMASLDFDRARDSEINLPMNDPPAARGVASGFEPVGTRQSQSFVDDKDDLHTRKACAPVPESPVAESQQVEQEKQNEQQNEMVLASRNVAGVNDLSKLHADLCFTEWVCSDHRLHSSTSDDKDDDLSYARATISSMAKSRPKYTNEADEASRRRSFGRSSDSQSYASRSIPLRQDACVRIPAEILLGRKQNMLLPTSEQRFNESNNGMVLARYGSRDAGENDNFILLPREHTSTPDILQVPNGRDSLVCSPVSENFRDDRESSSLLLALTRSEGENEPFVVIDSISGSTEGDGYVFARNTEYPLKTITTSDHAVGGRVSPRKGFSRSPRLQSVLERLRERREEEYRLSNVGERNMSNSDSLDPEELFSKYDKIVKGMTVSPRTRLLRIKERHKKRLNSNGEESISIVDLSSQEPKSQVPKRRASSTPRRRRRSRSPIAISKSRFTTEGSSYSVQSSSSGTSAGVQTQRARELRTQLEEALKTSARIRKSQEKLGLDLITFKTKVAQRRKNAPTSPFSSNTPKSAPPELLHTRSRSIPYSPSGSYIASGPFEATERPGSSVNQTESKSAPNSPTKAQVRSPTRILDQIGRSLLDSNKGPNSNSPHELLNEEVNLVPTTSSDDDSIRMQQLSQIIHALKKN